MDNNSDTIIINKYASRRLYNTNSSEYVTLDDLCRLINEGKNFKIIDKDSGKDITNQYLLQRDYKSPPIPLLLLKFLKPHRT